MEDARKTNAKAMANAIDKAWQEFLSKKSKPKNEEEKSKLFKKFIEGYNPQLSALFSVIEVNAMLSQINLLVTGKKYEEALKELDKISKLKLEDNTKIMVQSMKISCTIALGDLKKALKMTNELKKSSENLAYFHLSQIEAKQGNLEQALENINKCLKIKESFDSLYLKSEILKVMNNKEWELVRERAKQLERETVEKIQQGAKEHGLNVKKKGEFLEVN